jgi:hypothetical protein
MRANQLSSAVFPNRLRNWYPIRLTGINKKMKTPEEKSMTL